LFTLINYLEQNRLSNYVAPYGFAGVGLLSFDAKTDYPPRGPNESGTDQSSVIGLGLLFYISKTVDFFVQYEHHFGTDDLDLRQRPGTYSDSFIAGVAGLKINFGPRNARHASWRRAPVDIFEDDYNRLMALHGRMDDLERRVNQDMEDLSGRVGTLETRVDDHETRIKDLEDKFANLDSRVRDIEKRYEKVETDKDMFADGLPNGHYVQVYASHGISSARKVRENTVRIVQGMLDNADSMVFITKRRQFYEVRVGVFNRFPEAANVMRTAQGTYSDAFVVTFPRPPHLRELYRDIRRVE
jgi:tetrahydromethanopterin S-methyltransferase subunit G